MEILEQFRAFYKRNYPDDMEKAIELFSIFGRRDVVLDVTQDIDALIYTHILQNFTLHQEYIETLLHHNIHAKRLLYAFSRGDRKIFSAFKKARLNNQNGGVTLGFLQQEGIVRIEYSREEDKRLIKPKLKREEAKHRISDKFLITDAFVRFWFFFIYPFEKEISKGDYENFFSAFHKEFPRYISLVFEELSGVLLDYYLQDEELESVGSYWDANVEIDVYIVTKKGSIYVAECKWTNHKINKKELNKLLEKTQQLRISPSKIVLFSKRGFSKELLRLADKNLLLFSVEDFKILVR